MKRVLDSIDSGLGLTGIDRVTDQNRSILLRTFWFFCVGGAMVFFAYHASGRISEYMKDPTYLTYEIKHEKKLPLPGITACYLNSRMNNKVQFNLTFCKYVDGLLHSKDTRDCNLITDTKETEEYREAMANIEFARKDCVHLNFGSDEKVFKTDGTGNMKSIYSLYAVTIPEKGASAVLKNALLGVWIHKDPHKKPDKFITKYSVVATWNSMLQISMVQEKRKFVKNCENDTSYDMAECEFKNLSRYVAGSCGCHYDRELLIRMDYFPIAMKKEYKKCINETQKSCSHEMYKKYRKDIDCMTKCAKDTLKLSFLTSTQVGDSYEKIQGNGQFSNVTYLRLTAKVLVFYSSLSVTNIEEHYQYDWLGILSDMGGTFGILAGGCIFTLFQLVELILIGISQIFTICVYDKGKNKLQNEGTKTGNEPKA